MTTTANPIVDRSGRPMFLCAECGSPLSADDFFDLSLRLPDAGETADDYYSAEVLDDISHRACSEARRAG